MKEKLKNFKMYKSLNSYRETISERVKEIKQQEKIQLFFELSLDLFCIIGMDGYLKKVIQSFSSILGFSNHELLSTPFIQFVYHEDRGLTRNKMNDLKNGISVINFENRFLCKNGNLIWISWRSVPVLESGMIYSTARDVTDQKFTSLILREYSKNLQKYKDDNETSLKYALLLQNSLLPDITSLQKSFSSAFILHSAKHIVSGDFFWFDVIGNKVYLAAADCTGHGIPGALLSIIGLQTLKAAIKYKKIDSAPGLIYELDKSFNTLLQTKKKIYSSTDGMDVAICIIDKETLTLKYSGVQNPVFIVRRGEMTILYPNKYFIGTNHPEENLNSVTFQLEKDDMLYMFSDGYQDQFGGPLDKKFGLSRFRNLLSSISSFSTNGQCIFLEKDLWDWKKSTEQTDDIMVAGIRI